LLTNLPVIFTQGADFVVYTTTDAGIILQVVPVLNLANLAEACGRARFCQGWTSIPSRSRLLHV
jgi:hypothetical protein